ncbi:FAD binding domain-containing protein [Colletotrichum abscissum]|uniref:FAD binding domain-containing protein n=1 Tax=Colletotrichum abscissum TaxID=1671311 RepID=A0A9P9XFT1_9PEZI|nr:FAD binding domain-containing protein [Colletotrichum abscissum]KAI3552786.1 FAD binding domain-containing protein [Colletotrichum abscissum]KAK1492396.1 FAD binding domain-containing protein [Colletotrichum abscissum]
MLPHIARYLFFGIASHESLIPARDSSYTPTCKSYPGTADWPSAAEWARLGESLGGGRLLRPSPPGAVCHPGQDAYNETACADVEARWNSYELHVDDPVSVVWSNFANDSCLPDPAYLCSGDGYPAYVVNATTPEHVKIGIDFARKNNVRLIVKSTGHDYLGRSIAPGSLSIWVHHLTGIEYHADEFKLAGSDITIPGSAVTAGGGTEMYDLYKATAEHGQAIVGGTAKTVSVGGYATGGGHSLLAPRFGLAADNVLQMEVVTPLGEILTLNEAQNADLFWAMRGGGGSTFGVLTSITFATHPSPPITHTAWAMLTELRSPIIPDLAAYFLSNVPSLEKAGLAGYALINSHMPNPVSSPGLPPNAAGVIGISLMQDDTDREEVDRIWTSINQTVMERWPNVTFAKITAEYPSWLDFYDNNYDMNKGGINKLLASRLLDEEALTEDLEVLAGAVKTATDNVGGMYAFLVSGKGVHKAKPRGGGDAVHPAWRTAYIHAITAVGWTSFNETSKSEAEKSIYDSVEGFRQLTPGGGSYLNEGLSYEEDWQHTFWGTNYERLLKIKKTVDPDDVFWCQPCVGNEGWKQRSDGQLCRV